LPAWATLASGSAFSIFTSFTVKLFGNPWRRSEAATALEERWGIVWCEVDPTETVLVANATGLTTYDAAYLWLAGSLGADLVTLDARLATAGAALME
jgi:predicted nucleic acid-binding protein